MYSTKVIRLVRGFIMKSSRGNTCIQLKYEHKHRSVGSARTSKVPNMKRPPVRGCRTRSVRPYTSIVYSVVSGFIMKSSRDNTCIQLKYEHKHRSVGSARTSMLSTKRLSVHLDRLLRRSTATLLDRSTARPRPAPLDRSTALLVRHPGTTQATNDIRHTTVRLDRYLVW